MIMVSSGSGGVTVRHLDGADSPPPRLPTEPTALGVEAVSVWGSRRRGREITADGSRLTGRVEFEGTRNAARRRTRSSGCRSRSGSSMSRAGIVTPGRVTAGPAVPHARLSPRPLSRLAAGGAGTDWTLKAAMVGGRDVSDEPLEIAGEDVGGVVLVFTDRPTQLSGPCGMRRTSRIRTPTSWFPRESPAVEGVRQSQARPQAADVEDGNVFDSGPAARRVPHRRGRIDVERANGRTRSFSKPPRRSRRA